MELYTSAGLGDILICKIREENSEIKTKMINIKQECIDLYTHYPVAYKSYITDYAKFLFPKIEEICFNNIDTRQIKFSDIKQTRITDPLVIQQLTQKSLDTDYIVIHTKIRTTDNIDGFRNAILPILTKFFDNFQTNYTIVLVGEKSTPENKDTKFILSIYPCLHGLSKNNKVIDLTRDKLMTTNTIELLKSDLSLIYHAYANIVLGYGGPLTLCAAFSSKTFAYTGSISHDAINCFSKIETNNYFTEINTFLDALTHNLSHRQ